jgi:phage FluMu gp28-like protein
MTERIRAKKVRWLPYHHRMQDDMSRFMIVEKSRRVGFDYCESYKQTMARIKETITRDLWYTSADESAAFEFAEYCRYWFERAKGVADYFEDTMGEAEDHKGKIKAFCIRFPSGARINCLTSSPRRMRSKGGDVTISEFAFHDDPIALYAAAKPVMTWGGRMTIGSSHNGEGSKFNQFCLDAKAYAAGLKVRAGNKIAPWSHHYVDIFKACEDGLVGLINETQGTKFTVEGFLEEEHAGCGGEEVWQQEYCCKPSAESSAWLTYQLIATCEDASCPRPDEPLIEVADAGPMYLGIDVGRKKDLTVGWFLQRTGDVLWTRRIIVLKGMPIPQQVAILTAAARAAKVRRTCVDATGLGIGISDGLKATLGNSAVEEVVFTGPVKEALAIPVRTRFEDRTIRVPDDAQIREGLHKVRKTVTAAGNVRFEGERDDAGHADEFWGLALAIEAAGDVGVGAIDVIEVGPQQLKPDPVCEKISTGVYGPGQVA